MDFQAALGHGLIFAYAAVFVGGLLTALTPCVYPLIPITVSIFGAKQAKRRVEAAALSTMYVLGIAATYTVLGVIAALTGHAFGAGISGNPWVIVPIALVFIVFAVSMFGAFELNLPPSLQARLSQVGGKGYGGALAMGLVAGLIAAPCTGPVLGSVLAYVGARQSVALGGTLLFVYAIGMGLPFFIIGTFAIAMPKSGGWMEAVKSIFGIAMLVVALYFLKNVLAPLDLGVPTKLNFRVGMLGIAALGLILGAVHLSYHGSALAKARKTIGIIATVGGIHLFMLSMLTPDLKLPTYSVEEWQTQGAGLLAKAKADHKPVMIDFGANWCPACKELELKTYPHPRVVRELGRFVSVKIDDKKSELVEQFGGRGLPYVVFYNSAGEQLHDRNLSGYETPDEFVKRLRQVN
jgi:thiol:disulfide interchange protein DsbD